VKAHGHDAEIQIRGSLLRKDGWIDAGPIRSMSWTDQADAGFWVSPTKHKEVNAPKAPGSQAANTVGSLTQKWKCELQGNADGRIAQGLSLSGLTSWPADGRGGWTSHVTEND
jgi:hypothetical protein